MNSSKILYSINICNSTKGMSPLCELCPYSEFGEYCIHWRAEDTKTLILAYEKRIHELEDMIKGER